MNKHGMHAAQLFARDGYVVLDGIFDPSFADELRAEYLRQYPDVASSPDRYKVGNLRLQVPIRMGGPFLSPLLYANPALMEFARAALGENFLIDSIAVVTALPGARLQHCHEDDLDLFPGEPFIRAVVKAYAITLVVPLIDLTEETGTTKLYCGSHVKPFDEEQYELPYVRRGDCYAMDYRLTHQGTANRSSDERPMVYLVYSRPWFTDINNYGSADRIRIAPDDLAAIPPEHRMLFRRLSADRSGPGGPSA